MNNTHKLLRICLATGAFAAMTLNAGAQDKNIYHKGWIDFNKNGKKDVFEDPVATIEKRIADLLGQMTVDE